MIKLKEIITNTDELDKKYPLAGRVVDGREILPNIDNTSSISASLGTNYSILKGIREVPMKDFPGVSGNDKSLSDDNKIGRLADIIGKSNKISPLIVVIDSEGPYILEGWHRISALKRLNAKSFPALVVVDLEPVN